MPPTPASGRPSPAFVTELTSALTPVLIAGGGPTGLALASVLARDGVIGCWPSATQKAEGSAACARHDQCGPAAGDLTPFERRRFGPLEEA